MVQQWFQDTGTFMIRSAILPLSRYYHFFNEGISEDEAEEYIKKWSENSVFRESILVASKNLYETMDLFSKGEILKKKEHFMNSLYKYLIRMSTRPTPFGLFAGVGFGEFTKESTALLGSRKYTKKARPDLEWLMKLVRKIETDYTEALCYSNNKCSFVKGNRVVLPHSTLKETDTRSIQEVNIRATKAYHIVYEAAAESASFSQLVKALEQHYPEIEQHVFQHFLQELIEKEYLISNIRPPLTVIDQLDYVIKQLTERLGDAELLIKLKEIQSKIDAYNCTALGAGEENYLELHRLMTEVMESKSPLQVDLSLQGDEPIRLNGYILQEVNHLINKLLGFLRPPDETGLSLNKYRQDFIEKYGQNREVPLLEMIDGDRGIGAPSGYTNPPSMRVEQSSSVTPYFYEKVQAYFWNKYLEALTHGSSCIEIQEEDILALSLPSCPYEELPDSFEINLIFADKNNLDEPLYYVGPNVGSTKAGKSFGRFAHVMDSPEKFFDRLHELNQGLIDREEYIGCEVSYLPNELRNANVTRNIHGNKYELALFTNSSREPFYSLTLNDILIGVEGTSFYAKSKRLNKKIIFHFNNMLNPQISPNAVRFLYDISLEDERKWYNFPWEVIFRDLPYTPMIKYRNFVLAPEKWVLNSSTIKLDKRQGFKRFMELFTGYRHSRNIPKYAYIASGDNRIIMNLDDQKCLKILYHEFVNNGNNVMLTAVEDFLEKAWGGDMDGHAQEIVIPMIKMAQEAVENPKAAYPEERFNGISSTSPDRLKLPFEEWIYLKLYGTQSREEELISVEIADYCAELINQERVKGHFYLRYADPNPHVRLRIRGDQQQLLEAYPDIQLWLRSLIEKGLISHFVLDCYDREIERYGGLFFMEAAEQVFCQDSVTVEKLIKARKDKLIDWSDEIVGVAATICYMEQWGWDYSMQLEFLSSQVKPSDYRDDFKRVRSQLINVCHSMNQMEALQTDSQEASLFNLLNERFSAVRSYSAQINSNLSRLSTHPWAIVDSLIHMHCNRLFGIDRELEKKLRALTCHTLYVLKHQQIHLTKVQQNAQVYK